jgi:cell wall-associated NlpC family hydrolase
VSNLARKDKDIQWEDGYVDNVKQLNELAKERIAFLATFKLPGLWSDDIEKLLNGNKSDTGSDGDGDGSAGTVEGNGNEEKTWNFLAGKGLSPAAIAGVMGNLVQESGIDPKKLQKGKNGTTGRGRGLCQWETPGRWDSLVKWAKGAGKDEWSIETQLEWMWKELTTADIDRRMKNKGSSGGFEGWKKMTDYKEACRIFEEAFERAGQPMFENRYAAAKKYYDKWGKNGPSKSSGAKGDAAKVIATAESWLKKPNKYVFGGGRSKADIAAGRLDCSSFCRLCYAENGYYIFGGDANTLSGNTDTVIKNKKLKSVKTSELQPGDLVFFDTYKQYGHITIYLGDGKCIGTQSSTGVGIFDMHGAYWNTRISATHRRVIT